MKSAYELAMERLEKESPSGPPLSEEQKGEIADIDNRYQAKIAERKILYEQEQKQAIGDYEAIQKAEELYLRDLRRLESERDEKKSEVRNAGH